LLALWEDSLSFSVKEEQNAWTEKGSNKSRVLTATIKHKQKSKEGWKALQGGSQAQEVWGRRKRD